MAQKTRINGTTRGESNCPLLRNKGDKEVKLNIKREDEMKLKLDTPRGGPNCSYIKFIGRAGCPQKNHTLAVIQKF